MSNFENLMFSNLSYSDSVPEKILKSFQLARYDKTLLPNSDFVLAMIKYCHEYGSIRKTKGKNPEYFDTNGNILVLNLNTMSLLPSANSAVSPSILTSGNYDVLVRPYGKPDFSLASKVAEALERKANNDGTTRFLVKSQNFLSKQANKIKEYFRIRNDNIKGALKNSDPLYVFEPGEEVSSMQPDYSKTNYNIVNEFITSVEVQSGLYFGTTDTEKLSIYQVVSVYLDFLGIEHTFERKLVLSYYSTLSYTKELDYVEDFNELEVEKQARIEENKAKSTVTADYLYKPIKEVE